MVDTPEQSRPVASEQAPARREEWITPRVFFSELRNSSVAGSQIFEPANSTSTS